MQRVLRPVEDALWRWNEVARREQTRNQAQAAALIPVIVQQATENVIAQLDFVRIVQQVPVDDIVAALDIEAIVARIDLGGVIRESTASLTIGDGRRACATQGIAVDEFTARSSTRSMFRKRSPASSRCGTPPERQRERAREGRDPQRAVARRAGPRAGFVSQAIGAVLDVLVILAIYFGAARRVRLRALPLHRATRSRCPKPGPIVNSDLMWLVGLFLLTTAWSGSGRAPGMAVVGLRVVTDRATGSRTQRAFWRAVFVVDHPRPRHHLVSVQPAEPSLYDMVCRTAVVYDWRPRLAESRQDQ